MLAQAVVERALIAHAGRVAVVDGNRRLTFEQLADRTSRLANALRALGANTERPVALLLPNTAEYIEGDLAATRAGVARTGIGTRLASAEWEYLLGHSLAAVLVTTREYLERLAPAALEGLTAVLLVDRSADAPTTVGRPQILSYEACLATASPLLRVRPADPGDPCYILYTSGTTGRPKGATHSQKRRVAALLNMVATELRPRRDGGMAHAAPLTHGSGSKVLAFLAAGAANVVLPSFSPAALAEAVERHGATHTFVVPTMIQRLLDAPTDVRARLRGLEQVSWGGAPMSASLFKRAVDVFGPIFTEVYGSCEAPHPITLLKPEEYVDAGMSRRVLESAGWAAWGASLRVESEQADHGDGQTGELLVRAPHSMTGYWRDAAATRAVLSADGWYRTGDVVTIGGDGLVTFQDRKRDLIISGGLNVYPAEVERVLAEHPRIREAAVVGYPSEEWGESVCAFVVPTAPGAVETDDVVAWVQERLASYKKPRRVELVAGLPHGASGKILKEGLREELWHGRERRVN